MGTELDNIDVSGTLETIEHLAQIGQMLVVQGNHIHMPTILEDIFEHAQRLTLEYV